LDDKEQKNSKRRKTIKTQRNIEETLFHYNKYPFEINMSTTAAAQSVLTIVKDEFAEVITEGTLSPTNKPTDWNIVITKKALLETMRTPSPPSEEI
jgi:hypothetical protein